MVQDDGSTSDTLFVHSHLSSYEYLLSQLSWLFVYVLALRISLPFALPNNLTYGKRIQSVNLKC